MFATGCVSKWLGLEDKPSPIDAATVVQAVSEKPIECNDKAMAACPGVDEPLDNAQDLANMASMALERLEVCQTKHHGELVKCVEEYRAGQLERRKRLEDQK